MSVNNTLSKVIFFVAGVAIGSAVTWKLVETKYRKIADEEIESMREYYSSKYETPDICELPEVEEEEVIEEIETINKKPNLSEYAERIKKEGYFNYSNPNNPVTEEKTEEVERPYVIAPEEFDELDGYNVVSLTYYADKILADDFGEIVDNADDIIGLDSLDHFGEYEDDSVFVRNDRLKCDYEILLDNRNYLDIVDDIPHRAED